MQSSGRCIHGLTIVIMEILCESFMLFELRAECKFSSSTAQIILRVAIIKPAGERIRRSVRLSTDGDCYLRGNRSVRSLLSDWLTTLLRRFVAPLFMATFYDAINDGISG